MSYSKPRSFVFAGLGVLTLVVSSCGSSNGSPSDAGGDISHKLHRGESWATGGDDSSISNSAADGTTGLPLPVERGLRGARQPPASTSAATTPASTPSLSNTTVTLFPTPVCMVPLGNGPGGANCDPAPPRRSNGANFHFCDGPDDPTSPGICIPLTATPSPGLGLCQIPCTAALDGTQASGCPGQDTCILQYVGSDPTTNQPIALGYCRGACEKDADCVDLDTARAAARRRRGGAWTSRRSTSGSAPQTPVTRTKQLGDDVPHHGPRATTTPPARATALSATRRTKGFCTQACIVGGSVHVPERLGVRRPAASRSFGRRHDHPRRDEVRLAGLLRPQVQPRRRNGDPDARRREPGAG